MKISNLVRRMSLPSGLSRLNTSCSASGRYRDRNESGIWKRIALFGAVHLVEWNFYKEAYDRIRAYMPEEKYVVIHDGFELKAWKGYMQEEKYKNVVLDTHQYLMVAEANGCEQTVEGYTKYIKEYFKKDIKEMEEYFPVICGEWCLFNSLACGWNTKGGQSVLNGLDGEVESVVTAEEKKKIYQAVAEAQLDAWNTGSGYFYWSYKLLTDTVNTKGWTGWDSWDLGRCVDFGWFPRG